MLASTLQQIARLQRLAEHAPLYGTLGQAEAAQAVQALASRTAWALAALGSTVVALNLAGMAGLLWLSGATPLDDTGARIALVAVPATPALVALAAWGMARRRMPSCFGRLRAQMAEDWMSGNGEPAGTAGTDTGGGADTGPGGWHAWARAHPWPWLAAGAGLGAALVLVRPQRLLRRGMAWLAPAVLLGLRRQGWEHVVRSAGRLLRTQVRRSDAAAQSPPIPP